jgi:hypothetical protein
MKCYKCGSEFRLTMVGGRAYCFECEADISLEQYGVVRQIREKRTA